MKTRLKLLSLICLSFFATICNAQVDLLNEQFPEAQQEIKDTFAEIAQSLKDGDMDKLIAFHAYSPKFTDFKHGEARGGSAPNEAYERKVYGALTKVVKFDAKDLKIAVYGDVANVTFHSDFELMFGEELKIVKEQTTLLFLKTKNGWKIVHEHHSPLNK